MLGLMLESMNLSEGRVMLQLGLLGWFDQVADFQREETTSLSHLRKIYTVVVYSFAIVSGRAYRKGNL